MENKKISFEDFEVEEFVTAEEASQVSGGTSFTTALCWAFIQGQHESYWLCNGISSGYCSATDSPKQ